MTNYDLVQATLERAVIELVQVDQFHLARVSKHKAIARTMKRLQEEMIDAKYTDPDRIDPLGVECRNLANLIEGLPGPVIQRMMFATIPLYMPGRVN